jgi:hypothetical protein
MNQEQIDMLEQFDKSLEQEAAKIERLWSVGQLRIMRTEGARNLWTVSDKCVSTGHPIDKAVVGEFFLLGTGATLLEAFRNAVKDAPKRKRAAKYPVRQE